MAEVAVSVANFVTCHVAFTTNSLPLLKLNSIHAEHASGAVYIT